jgi:Iap family predicted aminopeptidase
VFLDHASRADYGGPELQGKIGMFLGAPMPDPAWAECMMNSGLAAAILVDHRYHTRWPMMLGFPEMWASRVTMPLFSLAYQDAWELVQAGRGVRVKLWLKARRMRSKSANAIGDLAGVDGRLKRELIYVTGHVDTVRGSVGASDNASGIVQAIELARMLQQAPLKRTVRFVGYGVEERLSVGSYRHYQNRKKNGMARAVFGYNGDSCSTVMGWNRLHISGPPALTRLVKRLSADLGYAADPVEDVCPYSDQFPLNMIDVPTIWVHRPCMVTGNWFFHSRYDRLDVISPDVMADQARFAFELLQRIGNADKLPFPKALPNRLRREVEEAVQRFHGIRISLGGSSR